MQTSLQYILVLTIFVLFSSCGEDPIIIPLNIIENQVHDNLLGCSTSQPTPAFDLYDEPLGDASISVSLQNICSEQQREIGFSLDSPTADITQSIHQILGAPYDPDNLFTKMATNNDYSYSITSNRPGAQSVLVEQANIIAWQNAFSELMDQIPEGQRFSPVLEIKESKFVSNAAHASLSVESKAKAFLGPSVRSFFEFEGGYSGITYMVLSGVQTMTVFTDLPERPTELFGLQNLPDTNVCPVFLRGITFGKLHVMLFSIDSLDLSLRYEFEASINALLASGGSEINANARAILQRARLRVMSLGGNDSYTIQEALPVLSADIPDFVIGSSTWGKNDYGVPLSYHYVYLDGTPFKSTKTTTYTNINCEKVLLFEDIRTCSSGSDPAHSYELAVHLQGRQVLTGFGMRVHDDNVVELAEQHRDLFANGTLGPRESSSVTDTLNPDLEIMWEAPDGYVITNLGGGVHDDDFRTLKVTIARPKLNEQGILGMVDHQTILFGPEPYEHYVEAFCEGFTLNQVVRGVEVRVNDSNLKTLRLKIGVLPQ